MAEIYIDADVAPEPDDLLQIGFDYIRTNHDPDWDPSTAGFVTTLLGAVVEIVAPLSAIAGVVPDAIFRYFGASLVNVPPGEDVQATGTLTVIAQDNAGYTIPDGSIFALTGALGGEPIAFATEDEYVIPAGTDTLAGVLVRAVLPGEDGAGLTLVDLDKGDALGFILDATVDAPGTTGGADAEEDDTYLSRLSKRLELMAPRPILPGDFAVMALDVAGNYRAVGLQGYDPATNTWNNARTVAVATMADDGSNTAQATKDATAAYLAAERELNFIVNVMDPTRTSIDVDYTITTFAGYDLEDVRTRINDALAAYLSPLNWGTGQAGEGETPTWINTTQVRYLEISQVINNVDGVDYIDALDIGVAGGALGTADVNLGGAAPVGELGTIIGGGTVNAP